MLTAAAVAAAESIGAGALRRWPASLHPDHAERCYYGARWASRTWVDGLFTRSGVPRWWRIQQCGDPVVVWRADGAVSWQHRWCGDRACYACARSRSRRLATELRTCVEHERHASEALSFVTLTRPRQPGETAAQAWAAWQRAWVALRHTRAWRDNVAGGVRAVEVTWSDGHARARRRVAGWHVHAHIIMATRSTDRDLCPSCDGATRVRGARCETCGSATHRSDGTMLAGVAAVLRTWVAIVHGSIRAQCGVPLERRNVGQCAKYLTKLWELPPDRARELFSAATGKRVFEAFGDWRAHNGLPGWRKLGKVERTPSGWYASGVTVRVLERMGGGELVPFHAQVPGVALSPMRTSALERKVWGLELARRRASLAAATGLWPWVKARADDSDAAARVASRAGVGLRKRVAVTWRPTVVVAAMSAARVLAALRADQRPAWSRPNAEGPAYDAACAAVAGALERSRRDEHRGHVAHAYANRRTWEY